MYEVVLAVDADERARAEAQADAVADLPGHEDVRVTVTHVFGDNPAGASISQIGTARRVQERLEDADVEVELDERSGAPAAEILDAGREYDADLLCIGGRKRTPTGKALFGSVTQSVLLDSDRPVLVCYDGEQ
jgi:nucleotide-binding universal stress UspA family protein